MLISTFEVIGNQGDRENSDLIKVLAHPVSEQLSSKKPNYLRSTSDTGANYSGGNQIRIKTLKLQIISFNWSGLGKTRFGERIAYDAVNFLSVHLGSQF